MSLTPRPSDWLVSLKPMGSPAHHPLSAHTAAEQELRDLWSRIVSPVTDHGDADYEDFYEQAAKLNAAVSIGADRIWVDVHDGAPRNAGTGHRTTDALASGLRCWGSQATVDDWDPRLSVERLADRHATLTTFQRLAGRTVLLAGFHAPGCRELVDAVREAAAEHRDGRVFVKVNRIKYGIYDFVVSATATDADILDLLFEHVGYALMHLEEEPNAFIVQTHTPMEFEYRLFVVDHQVVAGSACVEEFTPLDNERVFDVKVRRSRHDVTPVHPRPDLVSLLVEFGRVASEAIRLEQPGLSHYALDVAFDAAGEPLIVELNALLNSGLYALDVDLVFRALDAASTVPRMTGA